MRAGSQHNTPPRFYVLFSFHVLFFLLPCLKLMGIILLFFLFLGLSVFPSVYSLKRSYVYAVIYEWNFYVSPLPKQTPVLNIVLHFIYRNAELLAKVYTVSAHLLSASCRCLVFMRILVARYNIPITICLVLQVIILLLWPCRPFILATWPTFCDSVHFFL
jgi:hypothetical protein